MDREKVIAAIIANCECWNEDDREVLNGLSDEKLNAITEHIANHTKALAVADKAKEGFKSDAGEVTWDEKAMAFNFKAPEGPPRKEPEAPKAPVANAEAAKPKTTDEWMAEAPPEIQSAVRNAMAIEAEQKDAAIKVITSNERNPFTEEQLRAKPLDVWWRLKLPVGRTRRRATSTLPAA